MKRKDLGGSSEFIEGLRERVNDLERGSRSSVKNRPLETFLCTWTGWPTVAVKSISASKQTGNRLSEILNRPDWVQHAVLIVPPSLVDGVVERATRAILERTRLSTVVVIAVSKSAVAVTHIVSVDWQVPPDIFFTAFPRLRHRRIPAGGGPTDFVERVGQLPFPEPTERLNEGKLILIGRGGVGKTSLVRRLTNLSFRRDEPRTHGISIARWEVSGPTQNFRLNVWDFGGQEIMHATHQFFMTPGSLYLLVLSGREGGADDDAEYWLKQIRSFGAASPVIVVQNKIDECPFDINEPGLRKRYTQIERAVRTDAETGTGIADLRQAIGDVLESRPNISVVFREGWDAVRQRLERSNSSFLSYEQFREIGRQEGITTEAALDELVDAFDRQGIALNFRNDPRLRETSVLHPKWITEGIYGILNASELAQKRGELTPADVRKILPENQYPSPQHLYLMDLMRKFSLCFTFQGPDDQYLVPELLPRAEPADVEQFEPEKCLNFEFHYDVLPEGLLPRFIVRSHSLSIGNARWRSGVILSHEGASALVMARTTENRVIVRVKGNDPESARRLLALIRYDFSAMHAEFIDLEVQERVPFPDFPDRSVPYETLKVLERERLQEYADAANGEIVRIPVTAALDRVDVATHERRLESMQDPVKVFFSFSHRDESLLDELKRHLKLLVREKIISSWDDRQLIPGEEIDPEIRRQLEAADIILLLISANFIDSDYCWKKELELAMTRQAAGEAHVVSVWLSQCIKPALLTPILGLPKDGKPVTTWANPDEAWTSVAQGVCAVAIEIQQKRAR